jgi:hypothetical protein
MAKTENQGETRGGAGKLTTRDGGTKGGGGKLSIKENKKD